MYGDGVTAYSQLYTLQRKLWYIAQFMDIKISAAKLNQESWDNVYDYASLANIVIEMYEKAYNDAPPLSLINLLDLLHHLICRQILNIINTTLTPISAFGLMTLEKKIKNTLTTCGQSPKSACSYFLRCKYHNTKSLVTQRS